MTDYFLFIALDFAKIAFAGDFACQGYDVYFWPFNAAGRADEFYRVVLVVAPFFAHFFVFFQVGRIGGKIIVVVIYGFFYGK